MEEAQTQSLSDVVSALGNAIGRNEQQCLTATTECMACSWSSVWQKPHSSSYALEAPLFIDKSESMHNCFWFQHLTFKMSIVHPVLKNDYNIELGESFYLLEFPVGNDSQTSESETVTICYFNWRPGCLQKDIVSSTWTLWIQSDRKAKHSWGLPICHIYIFVFPVWKETRETCVKPKSKQLLFPDLLLKRHVL